MGPDEEQKRFLLSKYLSYVSYVLLLVVLYFAVYFAIGDPIWYGGPVFAFFVIWLAAHVFGLAFQVVHLPPLLGMLVSGIVLRNGIPQLISGYNKHWSSGIRALALGTIFLRSGLELDWKILTNRRVGPAAARLLLIPGLTEAFVDGVVAFLIFDMPPLYGFTLGFILKAVGPAIVIQAMFDVARKGLGIDKGIPSIVVAAASFDDIVAITGFSIFSGLAINSKNLVKAVTHGPIDVLLGIAGGMVGAVFCSFTALWNRRWKRVAATYGISCFLLFLLYHFEYRGGGALACLLTGVLTTYFWERGIHFFGMGGRWTSGAHKNYVPEVEHFVSSFWRYFAAPLLFGNIGTLVDFKTLTSGVVPRSLAIVVCGLAVRVPTTFLSMLGAGMTLKEKIFVSLAWTPKATVQAALAALPLEMIRSNLGSDSKEIIYGEYILTTGVFAILVCAPLGVLSVHFSAPKLLNKKPPHEHEREAYDEADIARRSSRGSLDLDHPERDGSVKSRGTGSHRSSAHAQHYYRTWTPSLQNFQFTVDRTPITGTVVLPGGAAKSPQLEESTRMTYDEYLEAVKRSELEKQDGIMERYVAQIEEVAMLIEDSQDPVPRHQLHQWSLLLRNLAHHVRDKLLEELGLRPPADRVDTARTYFRILTMHEMDQQLHRSTPDGGGGGGGAMQHRSPGHVHHHTERISEGSSSEGVSTPVAPKSGRKTPPV